MRWQTLLIPTAMVGAVTLVTAVTMAYLMPDAAEVHALSTVPATTASPVPAHEPHAGVVAQAQSPRDPHAGLGAQGQRLSDPHATVTPANALPPAAGRAHAAAQIDPNSRFTHFRVGQRNVKRILADGELLWVGTSGGVIRYNFGTDQYRVFDLRSGLLANGVFHVGKVNGRIAVGTYGGGLALFDQSRDGWDIYNIPHGLGDPFVYDTLQSANGDIWIATWSGVNRVRGGRLDDPAAWELHTVANTSGGLPNDWVYALAAGRDGAVWLATEGGLAHFAGGEWRNWDHEDGLGAPYAVVESQIQFLNDPANYSEHHSRQKQEMGLQDVSVAYNPNYVVALLVDRAGTVWAGTWGGGLGRFDGQQWRNYTVADGLPANHVFALHQDPEGRVWAGTSNGLALLREDGFKVFTTEDGLYSNTVFSMETANDGSAWIGSFGGVARIASLD